MPPSARTLVSAPLVKGQHCPARPTDLRSPCPMINCLANHGYIPRDGRCVHVEELKAAMKEAGLSSVLGAVFSHPIFLERKPARQKIDSSQRRSWSGSIWQLIRNPWAVAFSAFAMRMPGQTDSMGKEYLNLDQLAIPGVVEHDISLTRRDHQQGDSVTVQPDLVRDLLESSSDGNTLTVADLVEFRKRRIANQRKDNPGLHYGPLQHQLSCGEIALMLRVFGDGESVRCDYVRAFFQEERLPIEEGWKRRRWWTVGLLELVRATATIKKLIGRVHVDV